MFNQTIINEALQNSRSAIVSKIQEFVDSKRQSTGAYTPLYDLLTDYPFRMGKMLRPTICISVARAVGGMGQSALATAAALELYHNAFLIHDDIEDGSESRRGKETLHSRIGIPRAINVGDATNVLAVGLLLENLSFLGVTKTLNILHEIEVMAQQSVEGQAMELDWVADNAAYLTDQDYFTMCVKKTCWYSFMTPCRIGLIIGNPNANASELIKPLAELTRFGMLLGIAFQIQDDLLNLVGEIETYGKEIGGDIYEGKRTVMLNHVITHSKPQEAEKILNILAIDREKKTPDQIEFILQLMRNYGSIEHGWDLARSYANQSAELFESLDFLQAETPVHPEEKLISEYFLCGPSGLMQESLAALQTLNVNNSKIHKETFIIDLEENKPKKEHTTQDNGNIDSLKVVLYGEEHTIKIAKDETILVAGMRAGIDPPFSCQIGACSTCRAKVISGQVRMEDDDALTEGEIQQGYVLTCTSHPLTNDVLVSYDD